MQRMLSFDLILYETAVGHQESFGGAARQRSLDAATDL